MDIIAPLLFFAVVAVVIYLAKTNGKGPFK